MRIKIKNLRTLIIETLSSFDGESKSKGIFESSDINYRGGVLQENILYGPWGHVFKGDFFP